MAMGIGQQIRDMVGKARHYWAELTDDKDSQQRAQHERDDAVHQRYGGVRTQDEPVDTDLQGRPADLANRVPPQAPPGSHSARSGESPQLGSSAGRDQQMQGVGQTQRQYTQQGGSGIQKTLAEQLADERADATPRPGTGRRRSGPEER